MLFKSRSLLLAVSLISASAASAVAQSNNPAGNMGSNNSVTASPGTADSKSTSGVKTSDVGSNGSSASNPTAPGGTGQTVVPGSTSSQANSAAGTAEQKQGTQTGGSK